MDPRGFPTSLPEFQRAFPNDAACAAYLEKLRWPNGFTCPKCGVCAPPWRRARRSVVLKCSACKSDIALTAGTVMEKTRTPLSTWFWAAYLVTTQTPGMSALQFQRQLGLKRYETAFQILHKLRAGMVRPDRDAIGGDHAVEVDETFVGGRTREGRGVHHKVCVVGAVEVRARKGVANDNAGPRKSTTYAGRLRLRVVKARTMPNVTRFVQENVAADAERAQAHLPMIHLVFSNLKTWLDGTHHGVSQQQQHLQAYLNEYVFRFNRRFYPMTTFHSMLGIAAHAESAHL